MTAQFLEQAHEFIRTSMTHTPPPEPYVTPETVVRFMERVGTEAALERAEHLSLLALALWYLRHPDVRELTKHFSLPGECVVERIEAALAKAEGRAE